MPNWYWEKKDLRATPSLEKGMDFDTETRYRREGVRFIMELGKALNLSHNSMATGAVYYQRFYMFHAFQDFQRYVVATCCLFLAGKAEETPKKCRDIIKTVRQLTNDKQFSTFGQDPREEIMVLERVLLQTIKFDLQVDQPYDSIIKFAKSLKGEKAKLNKMVQMSWTFVNDSLCTTLCLQWEPEIIAIAVMYLAAKLSKFEVKDWARREPSHRHWWDQFVQDLETQDLEEICHQVLDLYTQPVKPTKLAAESPPPGAAPANVAPSLKKTSASTTASAASSTRSTGGSTSAPTYHSKTGPRTPPPMPPTGPPTAAPPPAPPIPPTEAAAPAPPPPAHGQPPIPPQVGLFNPATLPPGYPLGAPPPGMAHYPPGQYGYPMPGPPVAGGPPATAPPPGSAGQYFQGAPPPPRPGFHQGHRY